MEKRYINENSLEKEALTIYNIKQVFEQS